MAEEIDSINEYERVSLLAKKHWDEIAKPIDSLGLLEDYVVKLCSISGSEKPYMLDKKAVLCLCADHGVVAEGVTQTDSSVTKVVSDNFASGKSTVNIFSKIAGADVFVVDVGIDCDNYPEKRLVAGQVVDRKIRRGTENLAIKAAMSMEECKRAVELGVTLVKELRDMGYKIIATGEMGIGNTTPTSALAAYILELPAATVTGKGAGLSDEGLKKKRRVIEQAVARTVAVHGRLYGDENSMSETQERMPGVLAEIGGLEIAAMVGVYLGGVKYKLPVIIDGAISSVAALVAYCMDDRVPQYALASHVSEELTGRLALERLGLVAMLHGRMCLGEGTGAVALMPLLDMAMEEYATMGSFGDYKLQAYHRFDLKR